MIDQFKMVILAFGPKWIGSDVITVDLQWPSISLWFTYSLNPCLDTLFQPKSDEGTLTHWGRDKMAHIVQTIFCNGFFLNGNLCTYIQISLKFVLKGAVKYEPLLCQIMAWHRAYVKRITVPMMACSTDADIILNRQRGIKYIKNHSLYWYWD